MEENNNQQINNTNVTPMESVNPISSTPATINPIEVTSPATATPVIEQTQVASPTVESQNQITQSTFSSEVKPTEEKKVIPIRIVIIIIVALIAIVLLCFWKFVLNKDSDSDKTINNPQTNNTEKKSDSINNTTSNPIFGSWIHCDSLMGIGENQTVYNDVEMSYTFNPDGTGKYLAGEVELIVEYDFSDNKLNMAVGGSTKRPYTYTIEGNTLNIIGDAGGWRCTKE